MPSQGWIKPAEVHPWTLGCRTCQADAEDARDVYLMLLQGIIASSEGHPLALYKAVDDAKKALEN
jgi:hypothetical protein